VWIERDARRSIEGARKFVEQLKKHPLFARRESGQHPRLGLARRGREPREQSLT
jgi:hypothetical protein